MKTLLIAAGLAVAAFVAAPASAAPVAGNAPGIEAPQRGDWNNDRDNRGDRTDRRDNRRGDRWNNGRRGNDRWNGRGRGNRWGNRTRCHNVKRHHRWVRVCNRW